MLFPPLNCMSPTKEPYMLEAMLFGDLSAGYRREISVSDRSGILSAVCQWHGWILRMGKVAILIYMLLLPVLAGLPRMPQIPIWMGSVPYLYRQTILWKLVFCHSPEQCEVRKMACVSCLCYRILAFFPSLSFFLISIFLSYQHLSQGSWEKPKGSILFTIFFKTIQNGKYNLLLHTLIIISVLFLRMSSFYFSLGILIK